jgi:hypothetical protein
MQSPISVLGQNQTAQKWLSGYRKISGSTKRNHEDSELPNVSFTLKADISSALAMSTQCKKRASQ